VKAIYDSPTPQTDDLPGQWAGKLSMFQKLLVLRCIRPDKCVPGIQAYVKEQMGQPYIDPPPFNLKDCYNDSVPNAPLIFVLSPGSDPMAALLKFSEEKNMTGERTQTISLGQGQGPRAMQLINNAKENGTWVVLQNCHLAVSFMPTLVATVETFTPENVHSEFRMWCTSYPSPDFPVALLQNGVKMTQEPPRGLRANMLQSYLSDPISDEEFYNHVESSKVMEWHKLCYGLCFFHALIQERRNYGPLGWNIPYGFNESDQRITVRQLQLFLGEYDEVPWQAISYTAGECNYGGRVTDDKDRRTLISILNVFYNEKILDDEYAFSPSGVYRAPPLAGGMEAIIEHIQDMPMMQSPEIFGFHLNADLTKDRNETNQMFNSIIDTKTGGGGGGGGNNDELIKQIAQSILTDLPPEQDLDEVMERYPTDPLESMNTVLYQEIIRFNKLTSKIREDLQQIQLAIRGLVVMSAELDAVGTSMTVGKVPSDWMNVSYPSLKPLAGYMNDLVERLAFFQNWLDNGTPSIFWFSGFFFQPAFLTGALQNFARKYTIPIDMCGIEIEVRKESKDDQEWSKPEDGVYIYGLQMEGARFNRDTMLIDESLPKQLFDELPVMLLKPNKKVDFAVYPHYECPCYKTTERRGVLATSGHSTNFVMFFKIPADKASDYYIQRGVALMTTLDD